MRVLILILLSFSAYAEYEFEIVKYSEGKVCPALVGTWYTNIIVEKPDRVRYITKLQRKADGSAFLRGINLYPQSQEVETWEFPSKWSCDGEWYVEKNEWGYTAFKIVSLGQVNQFKDERGNLGPSNIEYQETSEFKSLNPTIEAYLNAE